MYHYDPVTALEELREEASTAEPGSPARHDAPCAHEARSLDRSEPHFRRVPEALW